VEVVLAGFNIDSETIRTAGKQVATDTILTPETISAAYARISRNPLPVTELRKIARQAVDAARQSNERIVFDMGHSSIAEHAVFNLDILGVSRLIIEEIEKFRLASYTEKSQRYIRLDGDFIVPTEITDAGVRDRFTATIAAQNALYHRLYKKLRDYVFECNRDMARDSHNHRMLEGWAKEDARYIVSLATESQLGMTVNARNLELMIRRAASHPLQEVNEYGARLFEAVHHIAPSLIKYTEPTAYEKETKKNVGKFVHQYLASQKHMPPVGEPHEEAPDVRLIDATPAGDNAVIAAIMHSATTMPHTECAAIVSAMTKEDKTTLLREMLRHMTEHDAAPREFEAAECCFEIVLSATCFAQMKRHRMATILSQDYNPALGVTVPPAIQDVGMEDEFRSAIARTEETYERIRASVPAAAPYILTNAHRKRILLTTNARELYHISRLREDRHAQWDIRDRAAHMIELARRVMPLTLCLACGKDRFTDYHQSILHTP